MVKPGRAMSGFDPFATAGKQMTGYGLLTLRCQQACARQGANEGLRSG
jgi:hypothetical protein